MIFNRKPKLTTEAEIEKYKNCDHWWYWYGMDHYGTFKDVFCKKCGVLKSEWDINMSEEVKHEEN